MGSDNRFEGIDAYAAELITFKAGQLVGRAGFTESDRPDLEQAMVLDLLRRLPRFNPDRAERKTFIARVVAHQAAVLIDAQTAAKRGGAQRIYSLNDESEDEPGVVGEWGESIDQEQRLRRTGRSRRPATDQSDLSLDVAAVMAELPPALCRLCERLMTASVSEAARRTGMTRSRVREAVTKLRARFREAGMEDYL